jgi:hypothetical protein
MPADDELDQLKAAYPSAYAEHAAGSEVFPGQFDDWMDAWLRQSPPYRLLLEAVEGYARNPTKQAWAAVEEFLVHQRDQEPQLAAGQVDARTDMTLQAQIDAVDAALRPWKATSQARAEYVAALRDENARLRALLSARERHVLTHEDHPVYLGDGLWRSRPMEMLFAVIAVAAVFWQYGQFNECRDAGFTASYCIRLVPSEWIGLLDRFRGG